MIVGGQLPREKELTADNLFDKLNSQVRTTSTVPFSLSHNSTSIRVFTCDNIYHKQIVLFGLPKGCNFVGSRVFQQFQISQKHLTLDQRNVGANMYTGQTVISRCLGAD